MAVLRLALLGRLEVRLDSDQLVLLPRKKAQVLLAYLALHSGQLQPRDKLAALLWGEVSDERARHSLRQALVTLRQGLPRAMAGCLVEEGDSVGIDAAAVEVDVAQFERLAAEGTLESLERAAALYRGDLLEGISIKDLPFEEWLRAERERVRETAVETLAKLLAHQIQKEASEEAAQTAVRLLCLDPLQEPVHRALMRLYARLDRRGAALRQYQTCVEALERELGIEPEPATRQLYRELLQTPSAVPHQGRTLRRGRTIPEIALIGRERELTSLRRALEDARQGLGTVGVIQGEAGIGKTRLVEALVTAASDTGSHVVLGRAYESEQVLPFGPWVDAFRTGHIVPGLLGDLEPPWRGEVARLFPELGGPEREETAEDYVRLFEAMARALHHLAASRSLVVVLEDLHWADEMTLRLLVFLARRMADWPVLVLSTLRIEEMVDATVLRRTLGQLARQPRYVSIALGPLSQTETIDLVRALMKTGTEDAVVQGQGEHVWRASEGNPFMVVEIVRAMTAQHVGETARSLVTPPRVRELIEARLDRLSDRGRRLASMAAVIGREFDFTLLEHVAEVGATETAECVEELVGRRILHVVGERLDFTHERVREVVYDGLLPPYRRRLHTAVAHALEALHADDLLPHALALGRHYDAGEVWDRASKYLAMAGASAAARSAHREAVACFEQALAAHRRLSIGSAEVRQGIDLRFEIRHSCIPLADHRRVFEHLCEAEREAEAIGDQARLGWTFVYQAHGLFLSGDSRGALEAGQRGLAIAHALGDPGLEESANFYLGQVHHWIGNYTAGVALLRRNVGSLEAQLSRQGFAVKQFVNSRTFLAWCLAGLGEFTEATAARTRRSRWQKRPAAPTRSSTLAPAPGSSISVVAISP